jgi:hypothetical protein
LTPQTSHLKLKITIFHVSFLQYIIKDSVKIRYVFQYFRDSYHKNSWQIIIRTPSFVSQFLPRAFRALLSRAKVNECPNASSGPLLPYRVLGPGYSGRWISRRLFLKKRGDFVHQQNTHNVMYKLYYILYFTKCRFCVYCLSTLVLCLKFPLKSKRWIYSNLTLFLWR